MSDTPQAKAIREMYKIPSSWYFSFEKDGVFYFDFCDSTIKVDVANQKATETHMSLRNDSQVFITIPWEVE